jgi:hypothetical protein
MMAGSDKGIDDMRGNKAVGAGDEGVWHFVAIMSKVNHSIEKQWG